MILTNNCEEKNNLEYSNDSSLNPNEIYSFHTVNCLKRTNIKTGDGPFKNS